MFKYMMNIENVCVYMLDIVLFECIKEYIRVNLGYFIVIIDKCLKCKVCFYYK